MSLKTRFIAAWLVVLMLASTRTTVFAQERKNEVRPLLENGSPNLDVVFVTDCSSSMNDSDPNDIACEAIKLFMDICEYDSTRVCVVEYTEELKDVLPLKNIVDDRETIKSQIEELYQNDFYGWTDLSIGLTEAKNQLVFDGQALNGDRHPLIILLTDGKTILGQGGIGPGGRTLEDANRDLETALAELKVLRVPVYPIGLNYDGSVDKETIDHIADVSGGRSYMTNKAEDIPEILREIYALNIDSGEVVVGSFTGDGKSHDVTIPIPDSSIYEANIIILSGQDVTDLHLYDPNSTEIEMSGEDVVYNTSKIYTHIKLFQPMQGNWILAVTGAVGDQVTVTLLSYYNMRMDVALNGEKFTAGSPINAEVTFYNSDGAIDDSRLLEGATGILSIRDESGKEVACEELSLNGSKMTGTVVAQEDGDFFLVAHVHEENGAFDKESEPIPITVLPPDPVLISEKDFSVWMVFPFIKTTAVVPLKELVSTLDSAKLTAKEVNSEWKDLCRADFDSDKKYLELFALKSGSADAEFQVSDQSGECAKVVVHIRILPMWLLVLIVLLLLVAIAMIVKCVIDKSKPRLSGELKMRVRLEDGRSLVEAKVDLSTLSRKTGALPFYNVVNCIPDPVLLQQYLDALNPLHPFLSKATLSKQKNQSGQLRIFLPRPPKGWRVQINGNELVSGKEDFLGGLREYVIACDTQGRGSAQHELYLSYKEANSGGFDAFGGDFEAGAGSYGSGSSSSINFNGF